MASHGQVLMSSNTSDLATMYEAIQQFIQDEVESHDRIPQVAHTLAALAPSQYQSISGTSSNLQGWSCAPSVGFDIAGPFQK